jgi:hypothetical protein
MEQYHRVRYRIEHRRRHQPPEVLAECAELLPAMDAAREHAARLHAAGAFGHIAVVDQRHGYDVHVRPIRTEWVLSSEA